MNTRGIYQDRLGMGEYKKISEWIKADDYYNAVFEDESGKTILLSEKDICGLEPDKSVYLKSEDLIGVTLTFGHPKGFTPHQVIEELKGILPENYINEEIKKEYSLFVYSYCVPKFKATELSKKNQEKALEIHPTFFIHEIDVELCMTISINTLLGESVIYFSNYNCSPILSSDENQVLCIDEKDPFFLKVYSRYFKELKNLGWNPSGPLEEIQSEVESNSSILQKTKDLSTVGVRNIPNIFVKDENSRVKDDNIQFNNWKTTTGGSNNTTPNPNIGNKLDLEKEMIMYFRKLTENQKTAVLNLIKEM